MPEKILLQLLFTLIHVVSVTNATASSLGYYHIVPSSNSTTSTCNGYQNHTCITLQQFATMDKSNLSNVTLSFSLGKHLITRGIVFNNTRNHLTLISENTSWTPIITCKKITCFTLINITSVSIKNFKFEKCMNDRFDGGAIFMDRIDSVEIKRCYFVHNLVRARGGALSVQNTKSVLVLGSLFANNAAVLTDPTSIVNSLLGWYTCIAQGGAISVFNVGRLLINQTTFQGNIASCRGGAIDSVYSSLVLSNTHFIWNAIQNGKGVGGAIFSRLNSIQIFHSSFTNNYAYYSGAMHSINSSLFLTNTEYAFNSAGDTGGAILIVGNESIVAITNSFFHNNRAGIDGGAITILAGSFHCFATFFMQNKAFQGGSIFAYKNEIFISRCHFVNNHGQNVGGAIRSKGKVNSYSNVYLNNTGDSYGGAIYMFNGSLSTTDDHYTNNRATQNGGAIYVILGSLLSSWCVFTGNRIIVSGGAVCVVDGSINSSNSVYNNNYASVISGGAISAIGSRLIINNDIYMNNRVGSADGAALYLADEHLVLTNSTFTNNLAEDKSNMYIIYLTNVKGSCTGLILSSNNGTFYIFYSTVEFIGLTIFSNNSAFTGGAITSTQSIITFHSLSEVAMSNNTAAHGGAILLSESTLNIHTVSFVLSENRATTSGGGIYGYRSEVNIHTNDTSNVLMFDSNFAAEFGGSMHAISTSLKCISGFIQFSNNIASKGGGVSLEEGSQIYIGKIAQEKLDQHFIKLMFYNNSAMYGGGVYVSDATDTGVLCGNTKGTQINSRSITSEECFIQTLHLYALKYQTTSNNNLINTFFANNVAHRTGSDIYGGLLDRCKINTVSELWKARGIFSLLGFDSFDFIKATVQFDSIVNYQQLTHPYDPVRLAKTVTRYKVKGLISSKPVQVCFCINSNHNCGHQHPKIFRKKGERFTVKVVTVDQVDNPVNGLVIASVLSDTTRISVGQSRQNTTSFCTELTYNVFSTQPNSSIELYSEGPCENKGISRKVLNISFLPCECPNGLQPSPLEDECKCECDSALTQYMTNCQLESDHITVVRQTEDIWIDYVNVSNVTGFIYTQCPLDYCIKVPVNLSISLPEKVDKQCAFNHSGIMCGECERGLSLMFGISQCELCSNRFLTLLIAFALAGIALVAFILTLNITVATGEIHGLILYANLVAANRPTFLPLQTKVSRFFIAWVNLDLGIETCFYNGMDSYAKVLLQVVFPTYIILLTVLIILLCKYSGRFARLLSNKNPVATLSTLILLSYSKLIRTIITSLQYTYLDYPDGSREIVWSYDANVSYFKFSHIPRFIIASVIIILGSVYTLLLLFGQWFRKYSGKRLLRWARNTKYNAFIDAYHAPFRYKHRYWVGILLFARLLHHFMSAILPESTHILLMGCIVVSLVIFKLFITSIYKNWLLDTLESSFLINLVLFTIGTYYTKDTGGNQATLANTSIMTAFSTALLIVCFHIHTHLLMGIRVYRKLLQIIKQKLTSLKLKVNRDRRSCNNNNFPMALLTRPLLNQAPANPNHYIPYREPALNIIAPISTADYNVAPQSSPTAEPQPVTYTVVDIRREDSEEYAQSESRDQTK